MMTRSGCVACSTSPGRRVADEVTQLALARPLKIVGEAARRVTTPYKDAHPDLPCGDPQTAAGEDAATRSLLRLAFCSRRPAP